MAFFDSGIGGLNLLAQCARQIPYANFTYFADNFNMPYGTLDSDELFYKADKIFEKIAAINPHAAVIACNTVTAVCAARLRAKYSFPIIGVEPAIKPAARSGGKCLVLATPATASSRSIATLLERFGNGITQVAACPNLAEYIEHNIFNINESEIIKMLPKYSPESVVLGCTHYSYITDIVKKFYNCEVFDGIYGTADRLCSVLAQKHVKSESLHPKIDFCGGDEGKNRAVFDLLFPR
ncbi:MAG: glutamate racemase [Clostridiales bacterium]|nr:glutamate racemase [Clostridiales bacterium]